MKLPTIILVLNSERSDEYIDFTMIITSRNNASISNLRGDFRWKSEYPWCIIEVKSKYFPTVFKKIEKNKKKMTEKREFLRKISFRPNRFFYMVLNFQKFLTFFDSNFYEICRKRENLQAILKLKNHKIFCNLKYNTKLSISFPSSIYRENSKHHYKKNFNISRRYLKILPNLNFGVFRPLKYKPSFSPTTGNYILGLQIIFVQNQTDQNNTFRQLIRTISNLRYEIRELAKKMDTMDQRLTKKISISWEKMYKGRLSTFVRLCRTERGSNTTTW
ncbi:hypothetical protein AGLY_013552 [Aphis glycines]|uniref:Uncharacterized protein n=1 Tax=Aphis glycines TaxID=307491 RepID=A0A6G0T6N2_APHGL|nr:hypothetical protein AGLY_013552 [Aphis glycines]